jgi:Flp pilus assembly protein TadD
MTMYCAALDACPSNNLAANELGVLLCRTGHPAEAAENFKRAIDVAPSATAYHNLAVAQQKLGEVARSSVNELESRRLAAVERAMGATSKRAGIQWVSPDEMSRVLQPAPLTAAANDPAIANRPNQPPQHRWR